MITSHYRTTLFEEAATVMLGGLKVEGWDREKVTINLKAQ